MKRRSSYKITFFDRYGPEAGNRLKAYGYGLIVFGVSVPMFVALSAKLDFGLLGLLLLTLGGASTLAMLAARLGLGGGEVAAEVAKYVTAGGSSTPYEDQFSREQALVMQRDYGTALQLFEGRINATPNEPRVRIAAADLYATHGANPARAAELYREVQRIPDVASGHDIYAANKLADLYLGPLKDPGRALVEFRRLVDRYPGSTAAAHARAAIANLKPDLVKPQSKS
ncbi:MAG TPA: hypothetical protein VKH19_12675 [Gemmatimonadaceae bacterium]|nr:hypothetical protein [Gemmatimonadaceae bacterium]